MKKNTLLIFLILLGLGCSSQDIIYLKDKTTQKAKILEVNIDKVRYKKSEIPNGPTYEVPKSDIIKIRYANGFVDYFVPVTDTIVNQNTFAQKQFNTNDSSNIYILYHYGNDESQRFPIYFDGKYVCTLKNHSRLHYVIHSTGKLVIERRGQNAYKNGPRTEIFIKPGQSYGVSIKVPDPQMLDPTKRFILEVFTDSNETAYFIKKMFYGFEPYKENDFKLTEKNE
ncbi:MAG: hypothetical protein NTW10_00405 [Bacteroidetes bacterium]|nr:hypothetical protein [Bacteroidota bacterium]